MYDPTIHRSTLNRQFQRRDFQADKRLYNADYRSSIVDNALVRAKQGLDGVQLIKTTRRGKKIYQIKNLPDALLIRLIRNNIRRVTSVKQTDRGHIVDCIAEMLAQGLPFRAYKFDIKSFYETVDIEHITRRLSADIAFSGPSLQVLKGFFASISEDGISGLPRGMSISATLSEYVMRSFDRFVTAHPSVWYYSRFVDDMIIITSGKEKPRQFVAALKRSLPTGLRFNQKSRFYNFKDYQKGTPEIVENSIDFLGYSFHVSNAQHDKINNRLYRNIRIDISERKVSKIKTKLCLALVDFNKTGDFETLRNRIRLVTSNFMYIDKSTGRRRPSGIFYNYPKVVAATSQSLVKLDRFLAAVLSSPHPKNRLRPSLSQSQQQELLRLTFASGFAKKRFFHFSPATLAKLTRCWTHA